MSTEQNKAIVRRWIEQGWNTGDLSLVDALYAPNVVQHDPSSPAPVASSADLKQYVGSFLTAFPDMHFTIEDLLAENDKVLWRFTADATQNGPLLDIPPSGRRATVTGMALFRLAEGKIAEVWVNFDALGMLQSIGVVPEMR